MRMRTLILRQTDLMTRTAASYSNVKVCVVFLGAGVSFADVMLAPFYNRHWRGMAYTPTGADADAEYPWAPRMAAWAAAMEAHPVYLSTKVDAQVAVNATKATLMPVRAASRRWERNNASSA